LRCDPAYLADTVFERLVFAGTPYSHPADGTPETVRRLSPQQLRDFYLRHYSPSASVLAVVGDLSTHEALDRAQKYFGAWRGADPGGPPGRPLTHEDNESAARTVVVVDKPDAVQTEIRVGNRGIPRDSPDYYALTVANQILGGPASNHLFSALRSEHGLTYGASSDLLCYRYLGSWEAKTSTRTSETIKSVQLVLEQMRRLRSHSINGLEVETAQNYLVGHRALDFETSEGIASQVLDLITHNLELDDWNLAPQKINSLTIDQVSDATRRYLEPDRAVIVLVGNAENFKKDLKKLGSFRLIPLEDLDLASFDMVSREQGSPKSKASF